MHDVYVLIGLAAVALLIYMEAWFWYARRIHRLDVVDTAWGGSFAVVAWLAFLVAPGIPTFVVALLVSLWGGRLMKHTWRRHRQHDEDDPRYTRLSRDWKRNYWTQVWLKVFLTQGLLALVIAAPVIMNVGARQASGLLVAGVLLWSIGFYFESASDRQLHNFLADPSNKGHVMNKGLWRYSRHPNYFGESLQWWAIGLIALHAPWGWVGLIGPLLLTYLLVFVSGIPTVERGKDKKPEYRRYQQTTSPFIPLPPRQAGKTE